MARIIDLTTLSAVYATRLLVEAGHEVIRVESPGGDPLRRMGPFLGDQADLEHGAYHQFTNAGKRSVTINLNSGSGRKLLLDLVANADVLVASLPLPVEEEILRKVNPTLVLTQVEEGESEICAVARSGLLALTGHPGKPPVLLGGHLIYAATGLYVAAATAMAMLNRQLTGKGQSTKVPIMRTMELFMEHMMIIYTFTGKISERRGFRGAATAISGAFPCKDGFCMLSIPHTSESWMRFMEWVQDPVLADDKELADESYRFSKKDFVIDRLNEWTKGFTKAELVAEAQKHRVPASPISTPLDFVQDPQLIARGFLVETDHPEFGKMMFPQGAIASLKGSQVKPAPSLGQHNTEVLSELGYSKEDCRALVESGAI